jgi:hypothetical protein
LVTLETLEVSMLVRRAVLAGVLVAATVVVIEQGGPVAAGDLGAEPDDDKPRQLPMETETERETETPAESHGAIETGCDGADSDDVPAGSGALEDEGILHDGDDHVHDPGCAGFSP